MEKLLYESWEELLRTAVSAALVYPALILFIRVVGKRATSKMNNFDWIVTVAMGSMMASAIVLTEVTVIEGYVALATLLVLQFVVTKATSHSSLATKLVRARPTLLFFDGEYQREAMAGQRISEVEIEGAVRQSGYGDMAQVHAVILESNAAMSILGRGDGEGPLVRGTENPPSSRG